jgi:hypothetical protein
MRRLILSLVVLLEVDASGYAQDQLRGVYGPPPSAPSALGGVYSPPATSPMPSGLPSKVTAPDYGPAGGAPVVTVPGRPERGEALPSGVKPTPIAGRPGYGAAVVNGHRAIIDLNSNRIFQILD